MGIPNPDPAARFGQALGESYMRVHQVNMLLNLTEDQHKQFVDMIMACAPSAEVGKMILSGVMTQFGVCQALTELTDSDDFPQLGDMKLYHPEDKEDLFGGTDLYIELGDTVYAVQIKAYPTKDTKNKMLYPIDPNKALDVQLDNIITPLLLEVDTSRDIAERLWAEARHKANFSVGNLVDNAADYSNVVPLFMPIASPNSEASLITTKGEPMPEMVRMLGEQLSSIHNRRNYYLPVPQENQLDMAA